MSKALVTVLLFIAALFAGFKWWPVEYLPVVSFPMMEQKNPPEPQITVRTIPEPAAEETIEEEVVEVPAAPQQDAAAQQRALDDLAGRIAAKGARVVDKRLFAGIEACNAAKAKVSGEYQRRGIQPADITDSAAFADIPGASVTSLNNLEGYIYLLCMPHPQNQWAAYIQFTLTDEQIRLLNQGAPAV